MNYNKNTVLSDALLLPPPPPPPPPSFVSWFPAEDITGGQVNIDINDNGLPVQLEVDLCQALQAVGLNCPINKGMNAVNASAEIPFGIAVRTANNRQQLKLICVTHANDHNVCAIGSFSMCSLSHRVQWRERWLSMTKTMRKLFVSSWTLS